MTDDDEIFIESMKQLIENYAFSLRDLYFTYMIDTDESGTFQACKNCYMKCTEEILNSLDEKYADHIEGMKKDKKKYIDDLKKRGNYGWKTHY